MSGFGLNPGACGRVTHPLDATGNLSAALRPECTEREWIVPIPSQNPNAQHPPGWAVERATDELFEVEDPVAIAERAWELARDAQEREDERHDEYDDPDQGGEA
jgi:hypothetical protein